MDLRLTIDGTDFSADSNLESITANIGLNLSNESFNLETSGSTIDLRGAAAQFIKDTYINCNYPPTVLPAIVDTPYGKFNFSLLPKDVNWCCDGTASILLASGNSEELCFNRLNNTKLLGPGDEFWNYVLDNLKFKKALYSRDTTALNMALVQAVNIVSQLPNLFLSKDVRQVQAYQMYGTGRYHLVLSVNDILQFHADKCGRTFKSTILQTDPYNRMFLLPAANDQGFYFKIQGDIPLRGTDRYSVDMTVVEFLNWLGEIFYADWRINSNEVFLEPKEKLRAEAVNVGTFNPLDLYCFRPADHNCAKFSAEYRIDFLEQAGDSERDLYNHIEDYQINNRALSEFCELDLPFSPGINTRGRSANTIVSNTRSITNPSLTPIGFALGQELALSEGKSALPKLLINQAGFEGVDLFLSERIDFEGASLANPSMSFNRRVPGNLYDSYQYKRNPANGLLHCLEGGDIPICFDGTLLENMRNAFADGKAAYLESDFGNIVFNSASVTLGAGSQITINDTKIYP